MAAAAVGAVAQALALGLVPDRYRAWAVVVVAAATSAGLYRLPPTGS